ncbi:uncharacterized protein RHOBADRAFT_55028 [Rhodotorula graminis WP1]|uniref:Uncharacterized protein n=1 Tax=Rhodotorula graminis (strain WP1) TaxID=578459 RepID=A0A0P9IUS9_RHOGW|nr:uncharacterized protein RHOBADRAFT_55028 [Rhodotorula graminis WP1]KPV73256.1 hypothetical protein RHOBADRAFT_55028 [Rhodotorula graminis WP1]
MHPRKRTQPGDWALSNPLRPPALRQSDLASSLFAKPFSRQTALEAHHSCVNALALSNGDDPRWLATAGDDQRVLLWNALAHTNGDDDHHNGLAPDPVGCYRGARSNIFAIAFTADNSRILSCGNDATILAHDLETSSRTFPHNLDEGVPPLDAWLDHDDAVMSLSAHPHNPHLFLSASTDGAIHQYDSRTSPGLVGTIVDTYGMNDVVHHPVTPELFVYSAELGHVALVDGRMAWSDAGAEGAKIASEVAVVRYETTLSRLAPTSSSPAPDPARAPTQTARPNVSSSALSPSGNLVCATLSGHLPTLYELSDPVPLATFSAPALSSPAPPAPSAPSSGYRNTTTTKHGSFGGGRGAEPGRGLYYAAGSDDFGTYLWEVPRLEVLREGRREVSVDELEKGQIAFPHTWTTRIDDDPLSLFRPLPDRLTVPALVSPAHATLKAHRSIVNTALFHPTLPVLYTSGVEKLVVQHEAHLPGSGLSRPRSTTTTPAPARRTWRYVPREAARSTSIADLLVRANATLEPDPSSSSSGGGGGGPSASARERERVRGEDDAERRRRAEDTAVLEYFDGLVAEEADGEELWRERGDDDEDMSSGEEEALALREIDEERWAAEEGWGT